MKSKWIIGLLALTLIGAGCSNLPDVSSSDTIPEAPPKTAPPEPPENIPLPTPVQPQSGENAPVY